MKALSLWQPWASAIAVGAKKIETRGRRMNYRGLLAIHAAKKRSRELDNVSLALARMLRGCVDLPGPSDLPRGAVVAIVEVVTCREMDRAWIDEQHAIERALGDWQPGRFGIVLTCVRRLAKPYPLRGRQGLWNIGADDQAAIERLAA